MLVPHPEDGRRWGVLVPWKTWGPDARPEGFDAAVRPDGTERDLMVSDVLALLDGAEFNVARPYETVRLSDGAGFFYLPTPRDE